jgi:hypothetical protein
MVSSICINSLYKYLKPVGFYLPEMFRTVVVYRAVVASSFQHQPVFYFRYCALPGNCTSTSIRPILRGSAIICFVTARVAPVRSMPISSALMPIVVIIRVPGATVTRSAGENRAPLPRDYLKERICLYFRATLFMLGNATKLPGIIDRSRHDIFT